MENQPEGLEEHQQEVRALVHPSGAQKRGEILQKWYAIFLLFYLIYVMVQGDHACIVLYAFLLMTLIFLHVCMLLSVLLFF